MIIPHRRQASQACCRCPAAAARRAPRGRDGRHVGVWRPLGHCGCLWPWHNIVAAAAASSPGLHGGRGGLYGLVIVECLRDFACTSELRSSTSTARVSSALIDRTGLHAAGAPSIARGTTRHPIHQIFTCTSIFSSLNCAPSPSPTSSRCTPDRAHCHLGNLFTQIILTKWLLSLFSSVQNPGASLINRVEMLSSGSSSSLCKNLTHV